LLHSFILEGKVYAYAVASSNIASVFPAPSFATAAAASSSSISGSTVTLTATGSSPTLDESALTYTWVASSKPTGAPDPFLSDNGDNSAKSATATLFQAGDYTIACQVSDGTLVNTGTVHVTVNPTLTSISLTPGTFTVASSASYHVKAIALDQFGQPLSTQPTFSWSASGGSFSYNTDTSFGNYTAPGSGSGPYTLTASATSSGHSASNITSITIGGGASPSSVPSAVTDLITSVGNGTDVQLAWTDGSGGGALGGFRIDASTDNGTTYAPIGFAGASDTTFIPTGLCSNSAYKFRVTPYNAAGLGTSTIVNVDSTSSDHGEGWYKVAFSGTQTTQSFTLGSTAHSGDSGSLTLANSGWVQAGSEADAVRKAFTGSFSSGYDSSTFTFGSSGAFRYIPDYVSGNSGLGPAIAVEDEFNASCHGTAAYQSAYVLVSATKYMALSMASDDQTLYTVPSGHVSVGTFATTDKRSSASDFRATVQWEDNGTAAATVTSLGGGNYGVYLSSIPSGESASSYALKITHVPSSTLSQNAIGTAAFNIAPPAVPPRPINTFGPLPVMIGVWLQQQMPTTQGQLPNTQAGGLESLLDWVKRGVKVFVWPAFDTGGLGYSDPGFLNFTDNSDAARTTLVSLARWMGAVRQLSGYYVPAFEQYIIPMQFVEALNTAMNDTGTSQSIVNARTQIRAALLRPLYANEWQDPFLYAVSIRSDEPNSGVPSTVPANDNRRQDPAPKAYDDPADQYPSDTGVNHPGVPSVYDDVANHIHKNHKLAWGNVAGLPFGTYIGTDFNSVYSYVNQLDILSEDMYPVNNYHGTVAKGMDELALLLTYLSGHGTLLPGRLGKPGGDRYLKHGASLQIFLECAQQSKGDGATAPAAPTPEQMGDEYTRAVNTLAALGVNLQGITWFPQGDQQRFVNGQPVYDNMGQPVFDYRNDNTTAAEAAALTEINANFRGDAYGNRTAWYPRSP
jgi:hypothetical protein